jgi:hypothetical protein
MRKKSEVGKKVFQLEKDCGANMCDNIVRNRGLGELGICKVSSIDHPLPLEKKY